MATIACPECGLPRAASEAEKPCPVCAVGHVPFESRRTVVDSHPTDGLARDVSQLAAAMDARHHGHRPEILAGVLGILIGAAGVLAMQSVLPESAPRPSVATSPSVAQTAPLESPSLKSVVELPPPEENVALAPPPRSVDPNLPEEALGNPRPPGVAEEAAAKDGKPAVIMEFNKPDSNYQFSSLVLAKGQTAVLRGRLKSLAFYGLSDVNVDASELVADSIMIGGRIDNVNLKIHSPRGQVICTPVIDKGSRVTLNVPEGKIIFNYPYSGIGGGSQVDITTRSLEIRGAIAGEGTRVRVTLANGGDIRLNALRGPAVLEYRKTLPDDVAPRIDIPDGQVDPKAVLRRVE